MWNLKTAALADIEAYEQTPLETRLEATTTYDLLRLGADRNPGAEALVFLTNGDDYDKPLSLTYAQLLARVRQTANLFTELGVGPTDVVTYLLPNLPQTVFTLWGAEAVGVVNPINPMLEPGTMADICRAAGTKVLVALGETPGVDIWAKAQSVTARLPGLKAVVRVGGGGRLKNGPEVIDFDSALAGQPADRLIAGEEIDPDRIASMYHTGGTTGTPKLAPHSHRNEAAMALMVAAVMDLKPGETLLCGLPLFHVNGTTVTGSAPFLTGSRVVLLSPAGYRDPGVIRNFWKIVERYRAVTFSAVPTILSVLLEVPKGEADLSSLRCAICGAAPLSVELFQRFEAYTGLSVLEGYGLTEGTCVSAVNPLYGRRKIGSVGLPLPYHGLQTAILDDSGAYLRPASRDEIGSVLISGPNVFGGYLEPEHNKGVWPREGWFNTGDLGRIDGEGYLWLTGRRKELIIRGGHNIDPAAIEDPLYSLDGVALAAAVGRPDTHAGEVPVVYVQLQEGANLTEADIADHLATYVGERASLPKAIHIVEALPLTAVGKLFKPALRWDAMERVFARELGDLDGLAEEISITAGEDKTHGTLVTVRVRPCKDAAVGQIARLAAEALSGYAIRYSLEVED